MSDGHHVEDKGDGKISIIPDNDKARVRVINFSEEHGKVQIYMSALDYDFIVYLSPSEAMKLSKRVRDLSIKALENE